MPDRAADRDQAPARLDHIGYDWISYARFCAAHPHVLKSLEFGYRSAFVGPAVIAFLLRFGNRDVRYETYVLAMLISALLTSAIFFFWPATTAWTHLGEETMATGILPALPVSTHGWIAGLLNIRHGDRAIVTGMEGLIAFPSYHCVMALTFAWALWPIKQVRALAVFLAMLTIVSAPIFGGHYVTDLIGGAAVATIGIVLAKKAHAILRATNFTPSAFARRPRDLLEQA